MFELSQNDLTQLRPKDLKPIGGHNKSLDDRLLDLLLEEKAKPNKIKVWFDGRY